MPGPPGPRPRTSLAAKLAAGLTVCGLLYAAGSLHFRATTGQTDFSVFYRTAQALQHDVPAGFYGQQDEPTGLQHCIPPPGTMLLFFMPWLSIGTAALVWAALNLALVALSAWCLWRTYGALDRHQRLYRATWLWAAALLAFLAIDAVQVGQFSVLFVACWLGYLAVDAAVPAASLLMLPAMIKLYPALLFAAPAGLRRWRQVLAVPVAVVLVGIVLPGLLYGARLPAMWRGFVETTFGGGQQSRLAHLVNPYLPSNQSLDVTLLRYLADLPAFSAAHPGFPHLWLAPEAVLVVVWCVKLAVLLATGLAAWRLGRRARTQPRWAALVMLALWVATLYLLLPETKGRYAVYTFPAWLPLLALVAAQRQRWRYAVGCGLIALGVAATAELLPDAARLYGTACFASVAVWSVLWRMAWRARPAGDAGLTSGSP